MLTSAFGGQAEYEALQSIKKKDGGPRETRVSFNRLSTINYMMNRLAATGKNLNPDNVDELANSNGYQRAIKVNNKFFHTNLKKWFYKTNEDGELVCASHKKVKKNKTRRRRSDENEEDDPELDISDYESELEYHMANFCSMLEGTEDACGNNERGKGNANFANNYGKSTKRVFGALKKWNESHLANCKKNEETRYKRSIRIMSRRLFDGVRSALLTIDEVRTGKWKRVFPKHITILQNGKPMDKQTLINMVESRYQNKLGKSD